MAADEECMNDPNFRAKLKKYEETFEKACKELGLSPQSRAKFANLMAAKAEDPLVEALRNIDDDDDEDE
jgi:phage terminase small subunit